MKTLWMQPNLFLHVWTGKVSKNTLLSNNAHAGKLLAESRSLFCHAWKDYFWDSNCFPRKVTSLNVMSCTYIKSGSPVGLTQVDFSCTKMVGSSSISAEGRWVALPLTQAVYHDSIWIPFSSEWSALFHQKDTPSFIGNIHLHVSRTWAAWLMNSGSGNEWETH